MSAVSRRTTCCDTWMLLNTTRRLCLPRCAIQRCLCWSGPLDALPRMDSSLLTNTTKHLCRFQTKAHSPRSCRLNNMGECESDSRLIASSSSACRSLCICKTFRHVAQSACSRANCASPQLGASVCASCDGRALPRLIDWRETSLVRGCSQMSEALCGIPCIFNAMCILCSHVPLGLSTSSLGTLQACVDVRCH